MDVVHSGMTSLRKHAAAVAATMLLGTSLAGTAAAVRQAPAKFVNVKTGLPHVTPTGNWAGYALQGKFSEVHGTFTVPEVDSGGGALAQWVGVDGYENEDLIQAGVSEVADGQDYAWWEILPNVSIPIWWMRVSPGDEITVGVRIYDGRWLIDILDRDTLQFFFQSFKYNGPAASVEWVTEAPSDIIGDQLPILPYAGAVQFSGLTYTGHVARGGFADVWMVADGAVQDIPSTVPSVAALLADGFSTEYVG